jgi:hypothetical protein
MKVSNIILDKEANEIKIYFEHSNYCLNTAITLQSISLYYEFNNITMDTSELVMVDHRQVLSNEEMDNMLAL